jgi:N-acyl-L-homoserine lactone synthetase
MSVRIRIATTPHDVDGVFALRHRVFVEEGYMAPRPDGRIYDRFDAYPGTVNIVAVVGDDVIGSVRYMRPTEVGSSVDEYFDPRPLAPADARLAVGSMLVLDPQFRGQSRITFNMTAMGFYWAASQGLTHIIGVVNPDREEGFARSGFKRLGPVIHSERIRKVPVQPMIADIHALEDRFMTFLMRQNVGHWLHAFEREFHSAGSTIFHRGDSGDCAYVIVAGRARVTDARGRASPHLEAGELFGELSLLSHCPRTSTVQAETDLDLMVLERAVLRAQLRENPAVAERMLDLLASRLALTLLGEEAPSAVMKTAKARRLSSIKIPVAPRLTGERSHR